MMKIKTLLLLLAGCTSSLAIAQAGPGRGMPPPMEAGRTNAPIMAIEPQTVNGVTYLCGGIGSEEANNMKSVASKYDLMMTFAASNGAYLADVNVNIVDPRGRPVLNVNCDAPIMLVEVPRSGRYRVIAETGGRTLTRTAMVSDAAGKTETLRMTWPVSTVDMGLTPTLPPSLTREGMPASGGPGGAPLDRGRYEAGTR